MLLIKKRFMYIHIDPSVKGSFLLPQASEDTQGRFSSFIDTLQEHHDTVFINRDPITFGARQAFLKWAPPMVCRVFKIFGPRPFTASSIP
jgi:hypothetical protein